MKKLVLFILISLPLTGFTQTPQLDNFFEKYSGREGYTTIVFTSEMFELFASMDNGSGNGLTGINYMKMITVDTDTENTAGFTKELQTLLPKNKYKELMVITEADNTIKFLMRQEGDRIKEFIMTIEGADPLLLYLEGDMDFNQLSEISETMDIEGLDNIEKIQE
jgi:glutathione peroxidase-family protein